MPSRAAFWGPLDPRGGTSPLRCADAESARRLRRSRLSFHRRLRARLRPRGGGGASFNVCAQVASAVADARRASRRARGGARGGGRAARAATRESPRAEPTPHLRSPAARRRVTSRRELLYSNASRAHGAVECGGAVLVRVACVRGDDVTAELAACGRGVRERSRHRSSSLAGRVVGTRRPGRSRSAAASCPGRLRSCARRRRRTGSGIRAAEGVLRLEPHDGEFSSNDPTSAAEAPPDLPASAPSTFGSRVLAESAVRPAAALGDIPDMAPGVTHFHCGQ